MKTTFSNFMLCMAVGYCHCSNAQSLVAPHPPAYSIVNTPGATLAQVIDTMFANVNPADSAEGGALDDINTFQRLWQQRVIANDASGQSMFSRYYNVADSIFSSIHAMLPPLAQSDSTDSITYATYSTLWGVLKTAELSSRNAYELTNAEVASLGAPATPVVTFNEGLQIIINATDWYGITTGVTTYVDYTGVPCFYTLVGTGGVGGKQGYDGNPPPFNNTTGNDNFSVHPNPTSGIVTFTYNVPDAGGDVKIVITNIVGEQIMEQHTGNNTGSVFWDPRNLSAGMYIYTATGAKGIVSKGKIVVVR